MLRTVSELLATVEQLPATERAEARSRIDAAVAGDARSCRIALGLLALDLAAPSEVPAVAERAADPRGLEVRVHVLDLDRAPATASA